METSTVLFVSSDVHSATDGGLVHVKVCGLRTAPGGRPPLQAAILMSDDAPITGKATVPSTENDCRKHSTVATIGIALIGVLMVQVPSLGTTTFRADDKVSVPVS